MTNYKEIGDFIGRLCSLKAQFAMAEKLEGTERLKELRRLSKEVAQLERDTKRFEKKNRKLFMAADEGESTTAGSS